MKPFQGPIRSFVKNSILHLTVAYIGHRTYSELIDIRDWSNCQKEFCPKLVIM